ncbi:hypothetical protein C8R44DRAFT_433317 [Mycena epipterygia]|nr:hypothetical protein C8R44DRAFT_433317 [Mycena epipterygia]
MYLYSMYLYFLCFYANFSVPGASSYAMADSLKPRRRYLRKGSVVHIRMRISVHLHVLCFSRKQDPLPLRAVPTDLVQRARVPRVDQRRDDYPLSETQTAVLRKREHVC